jgi:hypothetical protein
MPIASQLGSEWLIFGNVNIFVTREGEPMQISVRSYLTAGVAFVGAGAIALTPIQPLVPTAELRAAVTQTANVQLVANPIQTWLEVLQTSADNIGTLGQAVLANPAPILGQVAQNQLAYATELVAALQQAGDTVLESLMTVPDALRTGLTQLANGDIQGGVETLLAPVMGLGLSILIPIVPIAGAITLTAQNLANVVATVFSTDTILSTVLAIGGPILSVVNALTDQTQYLVDGLKSGDLVAAVNAVLNIPAALVGGVLNGHGNIVFQGFPLPAAGLLTPYENGVYSGIFGVMQNLREQIGAAIAPPAAEEISVQGNESGDSTPAPIEDSAVAEELTGVAEPTGTVVVSTGAEVENVAVENLAVENVAVENLESVDTADGAEGTAADEAAEKITSPAAKRQAARAEAKAATDAAAESKRESTRTFAKKANKAGSPSAGAVTAEAETSTDAGSSDIGSSDSGSSD